MLSKPCRGESTHPKCWAERQFQIWHYYIKESQQRADVLYIPLAYGNGTMAVEIHERGDPELCPSGRTASQSELQPPERYRQGQEHTENKIKH